MGKSFEGEILGRRSKLNLTALVFSILAGMLLIVSGTSGPTGIYLLVLQELPRFTQDALILTTVSIIALVLILLSSLGGFAVILGGYFIYKDHIGIGRLTIGLGAGIGIPWLLFILFTVMATQEVSAVIAQHSIVGWTGIILSFIARSIAK